MARWCDALLDALFPEACRRCDPHAHDSTWICARCLAGSPPPPPATCASCGAATHAQVPPPCGPVVRAATIYTPDDACPAAVAIRLLKFRHRRRLARPLGALVAHRIPPRSGVLLVPVPAHRRRLRERGIDHAALLARALGCILDLRDAPAALQRIRDTRSQVRLSRPARLANLVGAFVANDAAVARRSVVLVDDVLTTGATLTACTVALRRAGAAHVSAVVVARRTRRLAAALGSR